MKNAQGRFKPEGIMQGLLFHQVFTFWLNMPTSVTRN